MLRASMAMATRFRERWKQDSWHPQSHANQFRAISGIEQPIGKGWRHQGPFANGPLGQLDAFLVADLKQFECSAIVEHQEPIIGKLDDSVLWEVLSKLTALIDEPGAH